MIIPLKDGESLSRLFHINSEPWSNSEAYEQAKDYEVEYREFSNGNEPIVLPSSNDSPLLQLLAARRSCREYQSKPISLTGLSSLMACAYGITRKGKVANVTNGYFRTVPSAGGLFPLEIYLLARNVEQVPAGIYHYNVRGHSLELLRAGGSFSELDKALIFAPIISDASLIFFLTAVFSRSQKKYGPRGYRYILLEAGHVAQNLCLSATEQGLGSLCMGGYFDGRLNRFLGFDGVSEAVVYSLAVGYPIQHPER